MPTAGGLYRAVERGEAIGCDAIQIFTRNPNQWESKPLTDADIQRFADALAKSRVRAVVAHDAYLINLAAPDRTVLKKSLIAFQDEIERCHLLGIPHLVTHMGSHMEAGEDKGLRRLSDSIAKVIGKTAKSSVRVLIETTAGQGTGLGYRFEHLRTVMDNVNQPERLGVCLDTCHIFAAGYNLRTQYAYRKTMRKFGEIVGVNNLFCIHANDAKKLFGSRVDRHAHIGEGEIGADAFRFLVNDRRFRNTPILLETPEAEAMHPVNLRKLRGMIRRTRGTV